MRDGLHYIAQHSQDIQDLFLILYKNTVLKSIQHRGSPMK